MDHTILAYLEDLKECQRSKKTYNGYYHALNRSLSSLKEGEMPTDPMLITKKEIHYLQWKYQDLAVSTRHWYIGIYGQYLEWCGNNVVKNMKLMWPQDWRANADWLTPEECVQLMQAALTPVQRLAIILELCAGLRRVEILRLRVKDLNMRKSQMDVLGKGSQGGKWRTVYMPAEVKDAVKAWLPIRQEYIDKALAEDPNIKVPEELIIYSVYNGKQIGTYGEKGTGYDKAIITPIREKLNIDFSNHTLRRSFGRSCWLAGVRIETISNILGHEDVRTTLKYLGLNMDDQKNAMDKVSIWRQEVEQEM